MNKTVIAVCKCAFSNEQLKIIMPLQKTNLGAPTKRCPVKTEQIHRTPTPKCDPNKAARKLY